MERGGGVRKREMVMTQKEHIIITQSARHYEEKKKTKTTNCTLNISLGSWMVKS